MASKKAPTWVWVVLGIVGFLVVVCVVLVGGAVYMFRQHVQTEPASTQTVEEEFQRARTRFAGRQPLVEVRGTEKEDRQVLVHKPPETAERRTDLQSIQVLAYDPRDGRLVRAQVPVWLARMMMSNRDSGRRRITINGNNIEFDSGDLTFEDVERNGPGLIVDVGDGRGSQVLVWAE